MEKSSMQKRAEEDLGSAEAIHLLTSQPSELQGGTAFRSVTFSQGRSSNTEAALCGWQAQSSRFAHEPNHSPSVSCLSVWLGS